MWQFPRYTYNLYALLCFPYHMYLSEILYNRLEKYLDTNYIIYKEQIGFKKGSRTSDLHFKS
jgi:hypothetical protein